MKTDTKYMHIHSDMIESAMLINGTMSGLESLRRFELLAVNQLLEKSSEYLRTVADELEPDLGEIDLAEAHALIAQSEAFARTAHLAFQSLEIPEYLSTTLGYVINTHDSIIKQIGAVQ